MQTQMPLQNSHPKIGENAIHQISSMGKSCTLFHRECFSHRENDENDPMLDYDDEQCRQRCCKCEKLQICSNLHDTDAFLHFSLHSLYDVAAAAISYRFYSLLACYVH